MPSALRSTTPTQENAITDGVFKRPSFPFRRPHSADDIRQTFDSSKELPSSCSCDSSSLRQIVSSTEIDSPAASTRPRPVPCILPQLQYLYFSPTVPTSSSSPADLGEEDHIDQTATESTNTVQLSKLDQRSLPDREEVTVRFSSLVSSFNTFQTSLSQPKLKRSSNHFDSKDIWDANLANCKPLMKTSQNNREVLRPGMHHANGSTWRMQGTKDRTSAKKRRRVTRQGDEDIIAEPAQALVALKRQPCPQAVPSPRACPSSVTAIGGGGGLQFKLQHHDDEQSVITTPKTYTHETASNLFVFAELTGTRKRDIVLNFENHTLKIMASRQVGGVASTDQGSQDEDTLAEPPPIGSNANYMVTMKLPDWVDEARMRFVKTTFSTGLLELCIPKTVVDVSSLGAQLLTTTTSTEDEDEKT